MMGALFIVAVSWSRAETPAVHGAATLDRGEIVVRAEGGFAAAFPTALGGVTAGITDGVDVGVHAVTHAGVAFALGATGRWAPGDGSVAAALTVDESFFTVDEIAGIRAIRAPFGRRFAVTPAIAGRRTTSAGVDLGYTLGSGIRLLRSEETPDGARRRASPAIETVWGELAATWPSERGRTFVRVRAIVPVAGGVHPLGFFPWIGIGRTWGVR